MYTYRALSLEDVDLFGTYEPAPSTEVGLEHRLDPHGYLESGHYRPEWMWVALEGGRAVARMAFWGLPGDDAPKAVDWFESDALDDRAERIAVGGELVRRAYATVYKGEGEVPAYLLFTPPGWRDREDVCDLVADRIAAAEAGGLSVFVERHGFRWETKAGLPPRSTRLEFREGEEADFVAALRDGYEGTLDAYTREDTERIGTEATAVQELGELARYKWGPELRRLAFDAEGSLAGVIFPAHNVNNPTIGYIAVQPGHRGKGYVDDLLAEMMHMLVAKGAERITANTDLANLPMKAAFDRAGFDTNGGRIDMR